RHEEPDGGSRRGRRSRRIHSASWRIYYLVVGGRGGGRYGVGATDSRGVPGGPGLKRFPDPAVRRTRFVDPGPEPGRQRSRDGYRGGAVMGRNRIATATLAAALVAAAAAPAVAQDAAPSAVAQDSQRAL